MLKRFLVPEEDQVLVKEEAVRAATQAIFEKMGLTEGDAALATDVLVASDLRGCESHGVSNMLRHYITAYQADTMNPRPNVKVLRDTPVSALVRVAGLRWPVETAIEEGKDGLGMDHYEVRSWRGWHHHMTECLLAHHFLVRCQQRLKGGLRR